MRVCVCKSKKQFVRVCALNCEYIPPVDEWRFEVARTAGCT